MKEGLRQRCLQGTPISPLPLRKAGPLDAGLGEENRKTDSHSSALSLANNFLLGHLPMSR